MCNFSKEDVLALAEAVTADPIAYMNGDYTPYFYCEYCDVEVKEHKVGKENFKHKINCPVLIAQDILTGYKKEA